MEKHERDQNAQARELRHPYTLWHFLVQSVPAIDDLIVLDNAHADKPSEVWRLTHSDFRDTAGRTGFSFAEHEWPQARWKRAGAPHGAVFTRQ